MKYTISTITYPIQKVLFNCSLYQLICWPIQDAFSCRLQVYGRNKSFPADAIQQRLWFVDLCDMLRDDNDMTAEEQTDR